MIPLMKYIQDVPLQSSLKSDGRGHNRFEIGRFSESKRGYMLADCGKIQDGMGYAA